MVSLTEVHCRVIRVTVREGEVEAGTQMVQDVLVPALRQIEGYRGLDLLVAGHKILCNTYWTDCPGPGAIDELYGELIGPFAHIFDDVPEHIRYARTFRDRWDGEEGDWPPII